MNNLFFSQWAHLLFPALALVLLLWLRRGRYLSKWEALTLVGLFVLISVRSVSPPGSAWGIQPVFGGIAVILLTMVFFLERNGRRQIKLLKKLRAWALYSVPKDKILHSKEKESSKDILFLLNDHNAEEFLPKLPTELAGMSCQSLVVSLGENPPLLELAKKEKAAVLIHGLGNNGYDSFGVGYAAAEFLECPFGISLGDALPDSASLERGILRLTETKADMVVGQRSLDEQAKAHPGGLAGVIFGNALTSFLAGKAVGDATNSTRFFRSRAMANLELIDDGPQSYELRLLAAFKGLNQSELALSYTAKCPNPNEQRSLGETLHSLVSAWWRH